MISKTNKNGEKKLLTALFAVVMMLAGVAVFTGISDDSDAAPVNATVIENGASLTSNGNYYIASPEEGNGVSITIDANITAATTIYIEKGMVLTITVGTSGSTSSAGDITIKTVDGAEIDGDTATIADVIVEEASVVVVENGLGQNDNLKYYASTDDSNAMVSGNIDSKVTGGTEVKPILIADEPGTGADLTTGAAVGNYISYGVECFDTGENLYKYSAGDLGSLTEPISQTAADNDTIKVGTGHLYISITYNTTDVTTVHFAPASKAVVTLKADTMPEVTSSATIIDSNVDLTLGAILIKGSTTTDVTGYTVVSGSDVIVYSDIYILGASISSAFGVNGQFELDTGVTAISGAVTITQDSKLTVKGTLAITGAVTGNLVAGQGANITVSGSGNVGAAKLDVMSGGIVNLSVGQAVSGQWTINSQGTLNNDALITLTGKITGLITNGQNGKVTTGATAAGDKLDTYYGEVVLDDSGDKYYYITSDSTYTPEDISKLKNVKAGPSVNATKQFTLYTKSTILFSKTGDAVTYTTATSTLTISVSDSEVITGSVPANNIIIGSTVMIAYTDAAEKIVLADNAQIDSEIACEITINSGKFLVIAKGDEAKIVGSGEIKGEGTVVVLGNLVKGGQFTSPVSSKVSMYGLSEADQNRIKAFATQAVTPEVTVADAESAQAMFEYVDVVTITGAITSAITADSSKTIKLNGNDVKATITGVTIDGVPVLKDEGKLVDVVLTGNVKVNDDSNDVVKVEFTQNKSFGTTPVTIEYDSIGALVTITASIDGATVTLNGASVAVASGKTIDATFTDGTDNLTLSGVTAGTGFTVDAGKSISGAFIVADTGTITGNEYTVNGATITGAGAITVKAVTGTVSGGVFAPVYDGKNYIATSVNGDLTNSKFTGNVTATSGSTFTTVTFFQGKILTVTDVASVKFVSQGVNTISVDNTDAQNPKLMISDDITDIRVTVGTASVGLKGITPGTGFAISSGSVQITGNFSIDGATGSGIIDFNGAASELTLDGAIITGTGTISVDKLTIKGIVQIAEGINILVDEDCEIEIAEGATLKGITDENAGTVTIDGGEIVNNGTVSVAIDGDGSSLIVTSATELLNHMTEFGTIILGADITIRTEEVIPEGVKIDLAGYKLTFEDDASIKGATIVDSLRMDGDRYIFGCVVADGDVVLTLDSASVYADVDTLNDAEIRVINSKHTQINMDSAGTILGAYGDTVELVGVTIHKNQVVMAYGDLIITGNVKVLEGGSIYILGEGTMDVKGDLNSAGVIYGFGDITVSGSMTVGNDTGTAGLYSLADIYIGEGASLTILKTKDKNSEKFNTLDAGNVVVDGVLNVYGSVADSSIIMNGQLNFNGVSNGATVSLGAGVSVTVASVTGTIYIIDAAAVVDAYDEGVFNKNTIAVTGNKVTIQNAKNVTVAVDVTDEIKEFKNSDDDKEKFHVYITSMTVSGSIAAVSETADATVVFEDDVAIKAKDSLGQYAENGSIWNDKIKELVNGSFVGEIIIGKAVSVQIDADADIQTIVATAKGAKIVINNGEIVGLVTIGSEASSESDVASSVICAYYTITVNQGTATEDETEYYSNLVDAIALGVTVDDKEITLRAGHEISDILEIPAGVTVIFDGGASMTIKSSGEVRVIATGVLDASARGTTITVEGVLIIDDKETGIEAPATFTYQVKTEDGSKITYTGILGALKNTESGTITLQQPAVINADAEIKEGVTLVVPKGITLTVGKSDKKVTLTVNGTLEMQKGSAFATVGDGDYKPEIVIGEGIITVADGGVDVSDVESIIDSYVKYGLDSKTTALSNLTVAASKATFGTVTIEGSHSAGDIVFATAADAREPISITYSSTTVSGQRSPAVSVSSMKLVNASFTVSGADATFTGEIIGASAATDASIVLDGVKSIKVVQTYVVDATGTTQYLQIASAGYTGKVVIAEGTAYVGADGASSLVVADGRANTLSVSEGATLFVPKDTTLTTSVANGYRMFFVDGTVYVDAGTANINNASISGIVQIEGKKTTINDSEITGTVQALEKATDVVAGEIQIGDGVSVGDAATTIGANGTIIGEAVFVGTAKYMVIYSGADITAAKIEWSTATEKTTAKVTEFFINGVSYMTVYAKNTTTPLTIANGLGIELIGYDTPKNTAGTVDSIDWYSDEALTQKVTSANVGDYSKVYTKFEISGVPGKVSVGTGIGFYIDGLKVNYYGEGAGSITLKIGEHTVFFDKETGYDVSNVKILFNGNEVSNNGKITITADMESFTLTVSGAVPSVTPTPEPTPIQPTEKDDGMGITEYLLIVLVILAAILVVVVAIRMMRS